MAAGSYELTLEGKGGGKTTTTKLGLTVVKRDAANGKITGALLRLIIFWVTLLFPRPLQVAVL